MDKLAKAMIGAQEGTETGRKMADALARLGLNIKDLQNLTPEASFRLIGEALAQTNITAQTTADLMEVFGRGAGQLIPVLKNLKDKSDEIKASGLIFGDKELESLHQVEQAIDKLELRVKSFLGLAVVGFQHFGDVLQDVLTGGGHEGVKRALSDFEALQKRIDALNGDKALDTILGHNEQGEGTPGWSPELKGGGAASAENDKLEEKQRVSKLTDAQRIAELQKDQAENKQALARVTKQGLGNGDEATQFKNSILKDQEGIDALTKKDSKEPSHIKSHARAASDSLVKVGNFLGGSTNQIQSIGEKTNQILLQIHATLKAQVRNNANSLTQPGISPL
jgi:hypothetical protein